VSDYPVDEKLISDWRINYGLDTRSPADAMRWWHDHMDGKCPAGAVAALGLCIDEIERLRSERLAFAQECDDLLAELAEARRALGEIAWSNDSQWQADRARAALEGKP
jgi:hypothetical protein